MLTSQPQEPSQVVVDPEPETNPVDLAVARSRQAEADLHVQTVCLLILAFLAAGVGLYLLRPVLVPFVLALFFAACLKPIIDFEMRYLRMPRPLAVVGAIILAAAIITLIGFPLASSIHDMLPTFKSRFDTFVVSAGHVLERWRIPVPDISAWTGNAGSWTDSISTAFVQAGGIASRTLLVIVFTLFILLGRPGRKSRPTGVRAEIELRVQRYISQMVLLSAVAGIMVGIVLAVLGVKLAAMFGFLAFLLNFIPTIGSIIATLLPLPVILIDSHMSVAAQVCAIAVPATIQIWLGNIVQPRVLGNALDLHPIVILISLIFWSMIWGPAGAFLATPMTAVLRIVLEKIPATRPLADLLAGRIDAVF
jgi:AI-2 transport protein TqsA